MLRPDLAKWNQTTADLQRLALRAEHARTRERYLALQRMAVESMPATAVAKEFGRDSRTTMRWVRVYNESGPEALVYSRTGGRRPFSRRSSWSSSMSS
jgi:hypothetical protein